ncbi:MAG: ThuA domain-containing protein [Saprospiraceae bacterium]
MKKNSFVLLVIGLSYCSSIAQSNSQRLPVLIIDGFSNHDWQQTSKVVKWILERSDLFLVDVSTIPTDSVLAQNWHPDFSKYRAVIQNTNNIQNRKLRWPRNAEIQLERYVAGGGGLYILHSANNAFDHWIEYDKMIGMGWRPQSFGTALEIINDKVIKIPPGEGQGTGHGDRFNAKIKILKRHPINKGYPTTWTTASTEVYYFPRGDGEHLTVLSYAFDSTATHRFWPVEWIVKYHKGMVYNSSMGHLWKGETYPPAYRCAGFQTTLVRVTEWLATGKVKYSVPVDFPTADHTSLRKDDVVFD